MKRFFLAGLPILLISATIVPAAKATPQMGQLTTFKSAGANRVSTFQLTPFKLVYLAYQGYFQTQGIPSYADLISAHEFGTICAKDLVRSAFKANLLSEQTLTDLGYLSAVEDQLRALEVD
jgi:hypothetical protein